MVLKPLISANQSNEAGPQTNETWWGFKRSEGVVFVGVVQEKARVPRTIRKRFGEGGSIPWIDYTTA